MPSPPELLSPLLQRPRLVALLFFLLVVVIGWGVVRRVQRARESLQKARDELNLTEHRLRSVLDQLFVAVGILDLDGTVRDVNPAGAALVGLRPDQLLGRKLWEMPWWAGQSERQEGLRRAVEQAAAGSSVRYDEQLTTSDGTALTLDFQLAALREPDGRITALVASGIDVTARVRALGELEQSRAEAVEAAQRKDAFLATLSHELRNPLAPIRSAAQVLQRSTLPDERARNAVAVIERQGAQLSRLVDDLLDASRLKFGSLQLQREAVDLRQVIDSAIETSRPQIQASGHAFSLRMPGQPLPVEVDATRLAQCVSNLVDNACKFTPRPGQVAVEVDAIDPGWAVVRVRDNGRGIAPDMLDKVFELFEQGQRAGGEGNPGLGIGLALTRQIVEMHGGGVNARSAGEGQGSEFEIVLPLQPVAIPAPAPAPPQATQAPAASEADAEARILVVDDNADAASTLELLLEMQGFSVVTAVDGGSAMAAATAHRPRVVILDIGLPDMTGYEVARRIRQAARDGGWPHRPLLIALTGWGQARDRERAFEAGFDHHLTKPADPDKLAALVHEHLQPA